MPYTLEPLEQKNQWENKGKQNKEQKKKYSNVKGLTTSVLYIYI